MSGIREDHKVTCDKALAFLAEPTLNQLILKEYVRRLDEIRTDGTCSPESRVAITSYLERGIQSEIPEDLRLRAEHILFERLVEETSPTSPNGNETEHWTLLTLRNAYAPREPRKWLVGGLVKLPSLNIVYGAPGTLKTMLLVDLAGHVVAGAPWLSGMADDGATGRPTLKSPILWVDFDNGGDEMHERVEATGKALDLPEDAPFYYVSMPSPWLDASAFDGPSFAELISKASVAEAKLIVVDNLGVVLGNADENSASMTAVLSSFRRLSEVTGAAVVIVHHQRKQQGGFKTRAGDALRGHSSIEAALDLALLIDREDHAGDITIKATKTRGKDVFPFGAKFTYDHKEDGSLARAKFFGVELEDTSSDAAIQRAVIEALKLSGEPMNQKTLITEVKDDLPEVGQNRIRGAILHLANQGKLTTKSGEKTSILYVLPNAERVSLDELTD